MRVWTRGGAPSLDGVGIMWRLSVEDHAAEQRVAGHFPTHALAITAWACLVPLAVTFLLISKLPMRALEPQAA